MGSFRCYDSSNVIATLMVTNFHLNTTDVASFQMFVYGDVVYAQTCYSDPEKLNRATFICQDGLCCCNMALISFRLFRKNLGNLPVFFGQMVYRPPWQNISRTPMYHYTLKVLSQLITNSSCYITGPLALAWKRKTRRVSCRLSQSRSLGFLVWCGRTLHERRAFARSRFALVRSRFRRTIASLS